MLNRLDVLKDGYSEVSLVETWGSDERVIESARMSTNRGFQGWDKDEKLLRYLYEHKHLTPFEMCGATFEISAPIFVFREWQRHRTQSYNELSARYTEVPEAYYLPSVDRLQKGGQGSVKQGSGAELDSKTALAAQSMIEAEQHANFNTYKGLLTAGVSRELARTVLPVGTYSRMRASANLRNWLAFLSLRQDNAAQWEIRQYADGVCEVLAGIFPRTVGLFRGEK